MSPLKILTAAVLATAFSSPALAQVTIEEAEAAITAFVNAAQAGDRDGLMAILAPEFQIQRATGEGHDREAFVAGEFLTITEFLGIADLHVTSQGDLMVARYLLRLNATLDGRAVEVEAPRLTVFRREGDGWLVVAHANFAQLQ